MSLEVKSKSKILINLPFIILALILIIVTARLYFWEDHYYKSKLPWMKLQFLKIKLILTLLPTISLVL